MKRITDRQRLVLGCITGYINEHGYPPTAREIGEILDIRRHASVMTHLSAMERKGYIARKRFPRSIKVLVSDPDA